MAFSHGVYTQLFPLWCVQYVYHVWEHILYPHTVCSNESADVCRFEDILWSTIQTLNLRKMKFTFRVRLRFMSQTTVIQNERTKPIGQCNVFSSPVAYRRRWSDGICNGLFAPQNVCEGHLSHNRVGEVAWCRGKNEHLPE